MATRDRGEGDENFDLKTAVRPGIDAIRHNWAPILLMQGLAALLVFSYYRWSAVSEATAGIRNLKVSGGLAFVVVAGFVAGGFLPMLAKLATRKVRLADPSFWTDLVFNGFVYSVVAIEVDLLYRTQTAAFGPGIDIATLAKKNFVDMALFSPFLSIPSAVGLFEWRKAGFSARALREDLSVRFFKQKVVTALIPCWVFWTPMLFCIYALPQDLQFPFAQVIEATWCLLFIFIATSGDN